nr:HEPN domain-containing protein [uncultured Lachnoanaerobaculum sp.]
MRRDLSLSPRVEEKRELKVIELPIQFSLKEIKEHFEESLNEVKAQYTVADLLNKNGNENDGKTIWRSQVVLAEGLLDFFIHEMSKFCLFKMFTGQWTKSEKYYRFMVPMSKVEDAINTVNSKDWFFEYLNDRFSRDVFLSHESMKDQLNLIGIDFSKTMERAFSKESKDPVKYGKQVVIDLFQRRNDIAHQNDRSHASAKKQDITKEFVEKYITNIELIVNAIYDIALDNDIVK